MKRKKEVKRYFRTPKGITINFETDVKAEKKQRGWYKSGKIKQIVNNTTVIKPFIEHWGNAEEAMIHYRIKSKTTLTKRCKANVIKRWRQEQFSYLYWITNEPLNKK